MFDPWVGWVIHKSLGSVTKKQLAQVLSLCHLCIGLRHVPLMGSKQKRMKTYMATLVLYFPFQTSLRKRDET